MLCVCLELFKVVLLCCLCGCACLLLCALLVCVCVCVCCAACCVWLCVLLRVLRGMLCLELSRSSSRPSPSSPRTSNAEPPLGWTWASPHKMQGGGAQPSQNAGGELINESVCVRLCVCRVCTHTRHREDF